MSDFSKGIARELIFGDFNKGESTWAGVGGNVLIGLIPVVGQLADLRDTVAALNDVKNNYKDGAAWAGLGLTLLAWVPLLDSLKSGKKAVKKAVGQRKLMTALKESGEKATKDSGFMYGAKLALGDENWKVLFWKRSNHSKLLEKSMKKNSKVKYGLKNLIYDDRTHDAIRAQARRIDPESITGIDYHHLFAQNQNKWIPRGFKNSGLNYLELPAEFNRWMGGKSSREWTFRAIVLSILAASFSATYFLTSGSNIIRDGFELRDQLLGGHQKQGLYTKKIILE